MTTKRRPEHENPPEIFYNDDMAGKYAVNSRIRNIQKRMTERAIELLQLPAGSPCHILDVGCGSGLSGEVLEEQGHTWMGTDISRNMLNLCKRREFEETSSDEDEDDEDQYLGADDYDGEATDEEDYDEEDDQELDEDDEEFDDADEMAVDEEGRPDFDAPPAAHQQYGRPAARRWNEIIEADMGCGVPFRAGTFDGCVSVSAIQWLCNIDKKGHVPQKRLMVLFQTLYNCLRRGARAVFQFYPENKMQSNIILRAAMKCGFGGGLVVDFPHSARARKYYLVIYAGLAPQGYKPPQPLSGNGRGFADVDEYAAAEEESDDDEEEEEEEEFEMTHDGKRARVAGRESRHQYRKRDRVEVRPQVGTKAWVLMKKEQRRQFGDDNVKRDSKYTMRRRKPRF